MDRCSAGINIARSALVCAAACCALTCCVPASSTDSDTSKRKMDASSCRTTLFGKTYNLSDPAGLQAYTTELSSRIERSKQDESIEKALKDGALNARLTDDYVDKKMRKAMEAARACAQELAQSAPGKDRAALLSDLLTMADALHGAFMHEMPARMDAFDAMTRETELRHPVVGAGNAGEASDVPEGASADPTLPSSYWRKPADLPTKNLYYGFGRTALPDFSHTVFTYTAPKLTRGVHPGFDAHSDAYGDVKLKFGKQNSEPFAHRILWALGYNTIPVDYAPRVKVRWDPRIFTQFNLRKDESLTVKVAGLIPVYSQHLQRYVDPMEPVSEVVMADDSGKEVVVKPDPDWTAFKRRLYKNPRGRPELVPGNFQTAFASRIRFLIYRDVNVRVKDDLFDLPDDSMYMGNWDWNGDGNPDLRENRGYAFVCAWLNMFDPSASNNKLYMVRDHGRRAFIHYITDAGNCLGKADDAPSMDSQDPNSFPWSFTLPAKPGDAAIPLDGSYHPILKNEAFSRADLDDARWIGRYIGALTQRQIVQALVASGMSSAEARLYYNKLANRRNTALTDIGLAFPPLKLMDAGETFDYDSARQGEITAAIGRGRTAAAPDDDEVVVKGRLYTRAEVSRGEPAKYAQRADTVQHGFREPSLFKW